MNKFNQSTYQNECNYERITGPRCMKGGVKIKLSKSYIYEFKSYAKWPTGIDWTDNIEKGIKDGLIEKHIDPELGIKIALEEIMYDPAGEEDKEAHQQRIQYLIDDIRAHAQQLLHG